jgi:hypothetical protein
MLLYFFYPNKHPASQSPFCIFDYRNCIERNDLIVQLKEKLILWRHFYNNKTTLALTMLGTINYIFITFYKGNRSDHRSDARDHELSPKCFSIVDLTAQEKYLAQHFIVLPRTTLLKYNNCIFKVAMWRTIAVALTPQTLPRSKSQAIYQI